jgi:hypothetical protein
LLRNVERAPLSLNKCAAISPNKTCRSLCCLNASPALQEPEIKADPDKYTAILCIVSQSAAGVVSTASGAFSDRVGRRNSIYFSCTVMACVYVG